MLPSDSVYQERSTSITPKHTQKQDENKEQKQNKTKNESAASSTGNTKHPIPAYRCRTQVITEGLASLGLVRGVPDEEFHACVSALRDQAEKAGQGFLSAEVLFGAPNLTRSSIPVPKAGLSKLRGEIR